MIHHIKTIEPFYTDIKHRQKTFELRLNDRNYQVGDVLHQRQFVDGELTGRSVYTKVTYILQGFQGLVDGYCILGVERCEKPQEGEGYEQQRKAAVIERCH